uniref:Uncharacterized protein n=1 Tax=Anguilla anguilla TaxID=7936 RepID=A0A0E9S3X4_ANGAN
MYETCALRCCPRPPLRFSAQAWSST